MRGTHPAIASPNLWSAPPANPARRLRTVTARNIGIVTRYTSEHQGHRVPMSKMLWNASQYTNEIANSSPALKIHQNQAANRAPASSAKPTTTGAGNIMSPRIGLGKPNTLPCHDSMFLPQLTTPFRLQVS